MCTRFWDFENLSRLSINFWDLSKILMTLEISRFHDSFRFLRSKRIFKISETDYLMTNSEVIRRVYQNVLYSIL